MSNKTDLQSLNADYAALIDTLRGKAAGSGGGLTTFTFTPAETGLVSIEMDVPDTTLAVAWFRTDTRVNSANNSDTYESVAGITYLRTISSSGNQLVTVIRRTSSTSSFVLEVKSYNSALNNNTASTASSYGAAVLTWHSTKNLPYRITFYVNAAGKAGLRVGQTYVGYLIPMG